jgi:hypothetical protein
MVFQAHQDSTAFLVKREIVVAEDDKVIKETKEQM